MKPSLNTSLRWGAFRLLDRLAGNNAKPTFALPDGPAQEAVWLFVSTVGELHATETFLRALAPQTAGLRWVFLTDRQIYRESFLARFPDAEVVEISPDTSEAAQLARVRPPRLFVVAEIPVWPADAPCRLSFGWPYEAARHGAPVVLINGWRYGYAPGCRSDQIERSLLTRPWLALFDQLCVQDEAVAQALREAGADPQRITVTGNMKFDALDRRDWTPQNSRSPVLLNDLATGTHPVVVAGCVTDANEQQCVLDAFVQVRRTLPAARLVLAPRHPENPAVMQNLAEACRQRTLTQGLRSQMADAPLPEGIDCLVLDTMGELKDFYAAAAVAHVGRNHNILEPLAFGSPVTVSEGWEPTYPSYPVYAHLKSAKAIDEITNADALATRWRIHLGERRKHAIGDIVASLCGATERSLAAIEPLLPDPRVQKPLTK